jgi:hypothetical protein
MERTPKTTKHITHALQNPKKYDKENTKKTTQNFKKRR